jgi:Domain of unknown function (DUF4404)
MRTTRRAENLRLSFSGKVGYGKKKDRMIPDTISIIEERVRNTSALPEKNRDELLDLLGQLKSQVNSLSQTNHEQAQSIAGFTDLSAHEATRATKNPKLLQHSVDGLQSSVDDLEVSHPKLVAVVNRLADMLSNMGI